MANKTETQPKVGGRGCLVGEPTSRRVKERMKGGLEQDGDPRANAMEWVPEPYSLKLPRTFSVISSTLTFVETRDGDTFI